MDRKEYNRNYYYKRDKVKLDKYRKDYLKRRADREWSKRYYNSDKGREYFRDWYQRNKDAMTEKYRLQRLKEFVDSVRYLDSIPT